MLKKVRRVIEPKWVFGTVILLLCLAIGLWSRTASAPSVPKVLSASDIQETANISGKISSKTSPNSGRASAPGANSWQSIDAADSYSGGGISRLMYFTDIPDSTEAAHSQAIQMAGTLTQFAREGVSPLVIMEPVSDSTGSPIDFKAYRDGAYNTILSAYFQTLKSQGITDTAMGMWVYFPEANLPQWGPVDEADFAPDVVLTARTQKSYFPHSQSSIMLDAESYPSGSTDWGSGSYISLVPFIKGIPSGLIDSFGLQGFPWMPAANIKGQSAILNPAVYLNASLAAAAAKQLGTSSIWLNTGTFAAAYTNSPSQTVTMSPAQRQVLLGGVLQQANDLRSSGFSVAVNLFSQDKSATSEATDFSYQTPAAQAVLKNFIAKLRAAGVGFWLFTS